VDSVDEIEVVHTPSLCWTKDIVVRLNRQFTFSPFVLLVASIT